MLTSLNDGCVTIRRWRREDAPALLELARESAAEIGPWMMWTDEVTDLAGAERFITERLAQWDTGEGYGFCTLDAAGQQMLGGCALGHFNWKHRFGNVGYYIRTSHRGRGLTVAATRLLLRFGFEELKLQRLEILAEPSNLASQRVAEKLGAFREGVLRHRLLNHGEPRDAVMYSLLPGDFLQSAAGRQASAT